MNQFALWFGVDRFPPVQASPGKSHNASDSGCAILQRGATWLCLKYGPHGGGHGHPDKNNFVLYSRGRVLFPDPGTRPYGSPLHAEWDRVTLAHNTLVVDEASQAPTTGKLLAFGDDFAMTDAGNIYPGVRFIRTAALISEGLAVFVDRVTADQSHTFDLTTHYVGAWKNLPAGEPLTLPTKEGYQHLRDATVRHSNVNLTSDAGANVLASNEATDVITATGVGKSTADRIPMSIFRRRGREATFVWAVSLDGSPVKLDVASGVGGSVIVEIDAAEGAWTVNVDSEKLAVHVTRR